MVPKSAKEKSEPLDPNNAVRAEYLEKVLVPGGKFAYGLGAAGVAPPPAPDAPDLPRPDHDEDVVHFEVIQAVTPHSRPKTLGTSHSAMDPEVKGPLNFTFSIMIAGQHLPM